MSKELGGGKVTWLQDHWTTGSRIKSNSRFGRRSREGWRIDDVHDSLQNRDDDSLVNIESLFLVLFPATQVFEPGRACPRATHAS